MEEVRMWIKKAEEDLVVSEKLFSLDEKIYNNIICFHCQQAVEKYIKAFLSYHKTEIPKTHDITKLLNLCIEIDEDFKILKEKSIEDLTIYATELRYPDFFVGEVSLEETQKTLNKAQYVKEFVIKKIENNDLKG